MCVKPKMKVKIGIDFLMTVLLLLLMAYQIIGQELHEWLGAGMLILFLLHNILNIRWYGNLFRGKYTILRLMQTIINFSVLASMPLEEDEMRKKKARKKRLLK